MPADQKPCPHHSFTVTRYKRKRYRCIGCGKLFSNEEIGIVIGQLAGVELKDA